MICDREGLIGRNIFAIDGCKIRPNASKEWSGTFDELERKQAKLRRASQRKLIRILPCLLYAICVHFVYEMYIYRI